VAVIASKSIGRMGLGRASPPPHNKNSNSNYVIVFYPLPRLPRKESGEGARRKSMR